jgi:P4 family phage/plasmid primase-like protien
VTTVPQPTWTPSELGRDVVAEALRLAGCGVRVFPVWGVRRTRVPAPGDGAPRWENRCGCSNPACPNPAKHPVGALVPNGHNGATVDERLVAAWFRVPEGVADDAGETANGWTPYNLGVATGRGLLVIDVDVKQPRADLPNGLEVLDDWETWTQGIALPRGTRTIQTGSGGVHLWLAYDPALRIPARNRVLPGVDLKADGGYVLAAPSAHASGARYLVRDPAAPILGVPDDLRGWLLTVRGGRYVSRRAGESAGPTPDDYDFRRIVAGTGCPAGHRDYFVNDLCFRLRRSGLAVEDAASALRREWLRMEQPAGDEFPWNACLYKLRRVWDEVEPQDVVDIPAWRPPGVGATATVDVGVGENPRIDTAADGPLLSVAEILDRPDLTFATTDTGNGIRFAQRMRDVVRFAAGEGTWYIWDGNRWEPDQLNRALLLTEELVRDLLVEAARLDGDRREHVERWAQASQSAAKREAALRCASAQPGIAIRADDLDADPWLLVVRGGTLDLRTGQLVESRPQDLNTKLADVAYDPGARCPLWEQHVAFVTGGDAQLAAWLRRAVGYTLTGLTSEQKLFFLWGNGANGKSTFVDVVASLLGSYATQADAGLLTAAVEHPTQLAGLRGARLVVADETEQGRRLAERRVKALTGGKKVRARFMRRDFFEFTPRFKLWITGNHKPEVAGSDAGIWRRLKLVPFTSILGDDRRILGYDEVLEAELSGILNWALAGLADWRDVGGLGEPDVVRSATGEYRDEEDSIGLWLSDSILLGAANSEVEASRLYESYRWWCHANGIPDVRSAVALGRELSARGLRRDVRRVAGRTARVWLGVQLAGVENQ